MDICVCITDALCCTAETNDILNQLDSNKNFFKKLEKHWPKKKEESERTLNSPEHKDDAKRRACF